MQSMCMLGVNNIEMKKLLHKAWVMLVTMFGNIKVFKYPMFVVYDPSFFKMDGKHILKAF